MASWKKVIVSGSTAELLAVSSSAVYIQNGQLLSTPASTTLSGSFSGSFSGNGVNVTGVVTSSFAITASYVQNAQSASYVLNAQTASYVLQAVSASFATLARTANTASYVVTALTASYVQNAQTASYVLQAVSASFATLARTADTASYADNFTVGNTLTAQRIVVQTITSSVAFDSGSNRFGSLSSNTQTFTGSVGITGSLSVSAGVINQLTASFAITSSHALTVSGGVASYIPLWSTNTALTSSIIYQSSNNIGIGTASPTLPPGRTGLVLRPTSGQTSSEIVIQSNNNTDGTFAGLAVSNIFNDGAAVYQRANLHLRFGTNDLERMRITETGNVGIGTVAPTVRLDVSGSVNITGSLNVTGSIAVTPGVVNQLTSSFAVTASYIASAAALANTLTLGTGLTGTSYNGSAAVTTAISGAASLTTNEVPKWTGTGFIDSNILDNGTQVQIQAGASSGLSVAAGGVNVTGNSTFNNDLTVTGNLTVNGTATLVNSTNTFIKDQFIQIASGSTTLTDAGIIAQYNAAGSGSAFFLESAAAGTYGRWAVAYDLLGTVTSAAADEWMVTTKINASAPGAAVPTWGGATNGVGNMWVTTAGDIFIYA